MSRSVRSRVSLGVAMLPLAWFAGRRLAGPDPEARRWVAWSAVLVVASSPFAIRYSTEARMYMLAMDLVLLGYLAVRGAITRPTIVRLGAVALVAGALLYTQYWAFFLLGVFGALMVARALFGPRPERATAWKLIGALVVGGLLFVPWLPTFVSQMQHTGTPWDSPVSPPTNAALGIVDFAGGKMLEGWSLVLPLVLLALLALFARAVDARHAEINVATVPGVRWEWLIGAATLMGGLTLSYLGGTGFQSRYASVIYPLFALAVAFGVLVFADRRIRVGVLAVVVLLGFVGGARNVITNRTQASQVVAQIVSGSSPGDVVGFCPDQLGPDVSRILDARGVQQYAFPNLQSPKFVNWVDYADRNAAASPEKYADALLAKAGDHRVWMVWSSGYRTFDSKCEQVLNRLATARGGGSGDLVLPDDKLYEFMGLRRYDP